MKVHRQNCVQARVYELTLARAIREHSREPCPTDAPHLGSYFGAYLRFG